MWLEVVLIKTLCRNRCSPCSLHSFYFGLSIILALWRRGPSGSPLWHGPQAPEPLPDLCSMSKMPYCISCFRGVLAGNSTAGF